MYQSVIRDPGGEELIRIVPELCSRERSVVNGSILLVPAGTAAIVSVNGQLSQPYLPGRYRIFTGEDPFFVRLRHIMHHGDPAVSVSVFYISTGRHRLLTFGTGELLFREARFQMTLKALASCGVTFFVRDAQQVLTRLVGSYRSSFTTEDLEPCLRQLMLAPVREALSQALGTLEPTAFNHNLSRIAAAARPPIAEAFSRFGLGLADFRVLGVNVPDGELNKLTNLERQRAEGTIRTENEYEHLQRIWKGSLADRTMAEMLTGIASRGQAGAEQTSSGNGAAPMMQLLLLSQLLPQVKEQLGNSGLFGGANGARSGVSSAGSPQSEKPHTLRRCPACHAELPHGARVCPVCGRAL